MTDYIVIINIFVMTDNNNTLFRGSSEHEIQCSKSDFLEALKDLKKEAIDNFCKENEKYDRECCFSSIHQIIIRTQSSTPIF